MKSDSVSDSVNNIFWAYTSFFSTKVLNLVAIIILARYLDPAEFGLMAICLALMGYFEIMSQFGMGSALISAREKVEETATAVLVCGLVSSTCLAGILIASSGFIAEVYGEPRLESLLDVIAIGTVIRALTAVNTSFLFRELRLRAKLVPDIARGLAKGIVSIVLAVMGFGVWALIFGYLASVVAGSIVLLIIRPWRPTRWPDLATFGFVFRYGSHLICAETINSTPRLLDNLLVGKILGTAALGIYSLAFRIPELGIKTFTNVAGSVLHPVMSKIQDDPVALKEYYYGSLKYCALLMFGCGAAIAVLAEPLIRVLYTPEWHGMIVPMQLLAIAFAIGTLNMVPGQLFKALRRTELMFRISLINLPFFVGLLVLAVPYGITAVAFVQIVLAVLRFVPNYVILKRVMDVTLQGTTRALMPGLFCTFAATLAGLLALQLYDGPDLIRLLVTASAFGAVYLVAVRLLSPEVYGQLSRIVLRKTRLA